MKRLLRALERVGRVTGTGICFSCFGLGSVILAGVLPVITRFSSPGKTRELAAQEWIRRSFHLFVRLGTALRLWVVYVEGGARLREGPSLIVANHPTLMDVVFLLSLVPADCVVKREAWRNPALRGAVRAAGYIPNDDSQTLIAACIARLEAGRSVLLFPEGSRSPAEGLRNFKRGAAHIALQSGCRILPVVITCTPRALMKGQPWYALPNEILRFSLAVGDPIYAGDLVDTALPQAKAARRLTENLTLIFRERLSHALVS